MAAVLLAASGALLFAFRFPFGTRAYASIRLIASDRIEEVALVATPIINRGQYKLRPV